jgi:N-acetyl sugar amidotransferase
MGNTQILQEKRKQARHKMIKYQICSRCIMDTSDPLIGFDEEGICNHCKRADRLLHSEPLSLPNDEKAKRLQELADNIKAKTKGKQYDCIIGVSGGADSTYVAYLVKKAGLNPLAVHLDNGWDSKLAVTNIEKALRKLGIDLFTFVIDWEEFRDLQLSFLKASTPDSEVPSDHAISAILYRIAEKYGIKYIIAGTNISTESILPAAWSHGHSDWKYIRGLQKRFGTAKLKTFPHFTLWQLMSYMVVKRIKFVSILNYVDYVKEDAIRILQDELGWEYYGGKHHESKYTQFYQAYILPHKFGYDKRRAHLSSLIMAGQISRDEALAEMKKELYPPDKLKEDREYVINKFAITEAEFDKIMNLPVRKFSDYPSYENSFYYKLLMRIYRMLGKFGIRKIDF